MRLDYLKTFLTVARTRSFSIAAKELKTSQGTVSHQIAALEEYFDAELFKRTGSGVEVTAAGQIIKETAQRILQEAHDAQAKISAAKQNLTGTIRIAASTIPEEHLIPGLIAEFQKRHPDVKFKITAQDSLTSLASLQTGSTDFAAVGTMLGFEDRFDAIEIGQEQLVLIATCNHPLANRKSVGLAEIAKHPFISREETSGTRLEVEKLLGQNGLSVGDLRVAFELGSTESVVTAVSQGLGVSIISSIAAAKSVAAGLVKVVAITEAKNPRKLYMVRPRIVMLKPSETFWEFCRDFRAESRPVVCSA
jgi:DNA-binding transcriptional LysR family regulator